MKRIQFVSTGRPEVAGPFTTEGYLLLFSSSARCPGWLEKRHLFPAHPSNTHPINKVKGYFRKSIPVQTEGPPAYLNFVKSNYKETQNSLGVSLGPIL